MQLGTPEGEAADYLGMTIETLRRTYAHHRPDFQMVAATNFTS
jgi:hypothetical protein